MYIDVGNMLQETGTTQYAWKYGIFRPPLRASMYHQATRKKEFYERMVAHLMAQIFFHETRDFFSENVFCRHTTRPWGRRGGPVRNIRQKTSKRMLTCAHSIPQTPVTFQGFVALL